MEKIPTTKMTKNEILTAYEKLRVQYEEGAVGASNKKAEIQAKSEKAVVAKVSEYTSESIARELVNLKLKIGTTLTELSDNLDQEASKLPEIQEAIKIEIKNLEEIHNIKVAADTLTTLIITQEEKKLKFETDMEESQNTFNKNMEEARADWLNEATNHQIAVKDRDVALKKNREREKEAYDYAIILDERDNTNTFAEKRRFQEKELTEQRTTWEKELDTRENAVSVKEEEFTVLQSTVEKFSGELAGAVKSATGMATGIAENKAKQAAALLAKDAENNGKLSALKVNSLEVTIKSQDSQIEDLIDQLKAANTQVQEIAVKVIGSTSDAQALQKVNQIAMEQAKNVGAKK